MESDVDTTAQVAAPAEFRGVTPLARRRSGIAAFIDALTPPQSSFGASCTVIPPPTGETLAAVLARRLRDMVTEAQGDWLVDFTPIGNRGADEATSAPSVVAWADRAAIVDLETAVRAHGIDVRRVVPPMVGLLNLLGNARGKAATGATLVVHVSLPSLCIFLFDGEDLHYVRPLRDALASAPEQLPEIAQTEVQHTAACFRENQRGRSVEQVLVAGLSRASAEKFSRWLSASVGSPCDPFAVTMTAAPVRPLDEDGLAAHLPVLAGTLLPSMRVHPAAARPMNLLPSRPKRLPLFAAAAAMVLVCVSAAVWARNSWATEAMTRQRLVERLGNELAEHEAGSAHRAEEIAAAQRFAVERQCLAAVGATNANPMQPALEDQFVAGLQSRPWCVAAQATVANTGGGQLAGAALAGILLLGGVPLPALQEAHSLDRCRATLAEQVERLRAQQAEGHHWKTGDRQQVPALHREYRRWFSSAQHLLETRNHVLKIARSLGLRVTDVTVTKVAPAAAVETLDAAALAPGPQPEDRAAAFPAPVTSELVRVSGRGGFAEVVLLASLLHRIDPPWRIGTTELSGTGSTRDFMLLAERSYDEQDEPAEDNPRPADMPQERRGS